MKHSEFVSSIAGSSDALVQDYDLTGVLVRTIGEAARAVGAADGGLLVANGNGALELLSATSHAAEALETYQAFSGEGPCQECQARSAIEQAKGVLAEQEGIDMAQAYLRLQEIERDSDLPLSEVARSVILAAQDRRG